LGQLIEESTYEMAVQFRKLHEPSAKLLVLPNAWDAGSARIMQGIGATAVATTSAGVAWALGYPDGNTLPIEQLTNLVHNIVRTVRIPVSVDVEAGYSSHPRKVGENLSDIIDIGIAGINIEDGKDDPELLAEKVRVVRATALAAGSTLFINARTDVYLQGLVSDDKKVAETIRRAKLYKEAGADGIFVPGLSEATQIHTIATAVDMPLNVMAWPNLPDAPALGQLGARRLSAGSAIAQVLWNQAASMGKEFLSHGSSVPVYSNPMPYPDLQSLFHGDSGT
jgi:2-methylisocitrate lyase-like PEP mutase family enzyme